MPSGFMAAGPHVLVWLLTYLLHSTLLLGAVWLLTRRMSTRAAAAREALWKTALLGGLVTASLQVGVGLEPLTGKWSVPLEWSTPLGRAGAASISAAEAPVLRIPHRNRPVTPLPEVTTDAPAKIEAPAPRVSSVVTESLSHPTTWMLAAVAAWLGIAAFRMVRLGAQHARFRRRLACREIHGTRAHALVEQLAESAGFAPGVHLTASPCVRVPMAFGRNHICLPERSLELDDAELSGLLAHELAHLVRRDPAWLLGACALEAVFFFQPLNRLARRAIEANAEFLSDDLAATLVGDGLPLAKCLTTVASWVDPAAHPAFVSGIARSRSPLLARVERLVDAGLEPLPRVRWPLRAGLGLATIVLTVLAVPVLSSRAERPVAPLLPAQPVVVEAPGAAKKAPARWESEHQAQLERLRAETLVSPRVPVEPQVSEQTRAQLELERAALASEEVIPVGSNVRAPGIVVGDEISLHREDDEVVVRIGGKVVKDAVVQLSGDRVVVRDARGVVLHDGRFDDWAVETSGDWTLRTEELSKLAESYREITELHEDTREGIARAVEDTERALENLRLEIPDVDVVVPDSDFDFEERNSWGGAPVRVSRRVEREVGRFFEGVSDDGAIDLKAFLDSSRLSQEEREAAAELVLFLAARSGDEELFHAAIEAGASVKAVGEDECSVLHLAAAGDHSSLVEAILRAGVDVDIRDEDDRTPLLWATQAGSLDAMDVLLDAGARIDAADEDGTTPLLAAVHRRDIDELADLIARGADINAPDADGRTPLHVAVLQGDIDLVMAVIEHGAQVDARDADGDTPLDYARDKDDDDMIAVLRDARDGSARER